MVDTIAIADFSQFGKREIKLTKELLDYYLNPDKQTQRFKDYFAYEVRVNFDTYSGYVFLTDENYNVGMINREIDKLDLYLSCPRCGQEGFYDELKESGNNCCKEYIKDL